jgi:hypothetical protein
VIGFSPTVQRVTGWPHGECVRASYATILDLPIEAVPPFDPASLGGEDQGDKERAWLSTLGLDLVEISTDFDKTLPETVLGALAENFPNVPHLMSGISPRGFGHRCVGVGGEVVWDPHPSQDGLVTVYAVGFLVKR